LEQFRVIDDIQVFINLNDQVTFAEIFLSVGATGLRCGFLRFPPLSIGFLGITDYLGTKASLNFSDGYIVAAVRMTNESLIH